MHSLVGANGPLDPARAAANMLLDGQPGVPELTGTGQFVGTLTYCSPEQIGDQPGSEVFVADESNGTWGTAQPIAGVAALNTGGDAEVYALSCAPPGDCGASGWYKDSSGVYVPFVVSKD